MKQYIKNLVFKLFFYKIPKENFGRCISCDANTFCGYKIKCKATMEEQYKQIDINKKIKDFIKS